MAAKLMPEPRWTIETVSAPGPSASRPNFLIYRGGDQQIGFWKRNHRVLELCQYDAGNIASL
jgi:hypothetical protein